MPFSTSCDNASKRTVNVTPVQEDLVTPSTIEPGTLAMSVDSGDGSFEVVDDGHVKLVSGDALGDTVYSISGDADLGAGVKTISDKLTLSVTAVPVPQAAGFGFSEGAVEPK